MSWKEENNCLQKEFTGSGFSGVCSKLQEVAKVADAMNHHPDFEVYGYKKIRFKLSTHSEGKVTDLDHLLAGKIDEIFG